MPEQKRTPELIEATLLLLAEGKTLREASRIGGFSRFTWHDWLKADPNLHAAYHEARRLGADAIADDILDIVDNVKVDNVEVAKARLRADMRIKLLGKWQPDLYGEKVDVRHAGHDGGAVQVAYANVADLAKQMRAVLTGGKAEALPAPTGSDLL